MIYALKILGRAQGVEFNGGRPRDGLLFIQCRAKNEYQQPLMNLLAELRRPPTAPIFLDTDPLFLPKDMGHVYFITNHAYWSQVFCFEARMRGQQAVFSKWQNVERFGMPV